MSSWTEQDINDAEWNQAFHLGRQEAERDLPTLPTSVQQKELFKQSVKDRILDGTLNPLEFYRQAKLITDCIDELKKDDEVFECAYTEREKYGKEKPVINGSVIDSGSKTTYDYSTCGDSVWNELKEKIKEREKFLKALPAEGAVSPETGELIMPPSQKVSNFFTVKI